MVEDDTPSATTELPAAVGRVMLTLGLLLFKTMPYPRGRVASPASARFIVTAASWTWFATVNSTLSAYGPPSQTDLAPPVLSAGRIRAALRCSRCRRWKPSSWPVRPAIHATPFTVGVPAGPVTVVVGDTVVRVNVQSPSFQLQYKSLRDSNAPCFLTYEGKMERGGQRALGGGALHVTGAVYGTRTAERTRCSGPVGLEGRQRRCAGVGQVVRRAAPQQHVQHCAGRNLGADERGALQRRHHGGLHCAKSRLGYSIDQEKRVLKRVENVDQDTAIVSLIPTEYTSSRTSHGSARSFPGAV